MCPSVASGRGGGLALDRVWALCSEDGRFINGKSTAAIHLIRAVFAPNVSSVTLSAAGDRRDIAPQTFAFPGDFAVAGEWFSRFFERNVVVRYAAEGFPDDTVRNGPTVVSTATLQAVSDWFPGIDLEESRRRFRTSLEIGGVSAFWEDRLFGVHERDAFPIHRWRRECGGHESVSSLHGSCAGFAEWQRHDRVPEALQQPSPLPLPFVGVPARSDRRLLPSGYQHPRRAD